MRRRISIWAVATIAAMSTARAQGSAAPAKRTRDCQALFARRSLRSVDFPRVSPCVDLLYPRSLSTAPAGPSLRRASSLLDAIAGRHPLNRRIENRALDAYLETREQPQAQQDRRAQLWLQALLGAEEDALTNFEAHSTRFIVADAELGRDLAALSWQRGKWPLAERAAVHVTMLLPTEAWPQRELARVCLARGDADLAMIHLRRAIELGDASDSTRLDLAVITGMQGRAQAAMLALQSTAGEREALLRVLLALEAGLLDEAKSYALACCQAYPQSSAAWTLLARAHRARREPTESVEAYQRVLELDPGNSEAQRATLVR